MKGSTGALATTIRSAARIVAACQSYGMGAVASFPLNRNVTSISRRSSTAAIYFLAVAFKLAPNTSLKYHYTAEGYNEPAHFGYLLFQ
jgi:hypothetical protein